MSYMKRAIEPAPPPQRTTTALRCVGSTLVELPFHPRPGASLWIATLRPASELAQSWARVVWEPTIGRGWTIPTACTFGSVVEFGADTVHSRRTTTEHRWYGIAVAHEPHWLVAHGPFTGPATAEIQAQRWLAEERNDAIARNDPHLRTVD